MRVFGVFSVSLLRILGIRANTTSLSVFLMKPPKKSKFSCLLCPPKEHRGFPCSLLPPWVPDTSHGNPFESCSSPGFPLCQGCGCHPAELLGTSSGVLTSPCPLCGHRVPDVAATPARAPAPPSVAMETGEGKKGMEGTAWILDWDTDPTWEQLKREGKAWEGWEWNRSDLSPTKIEF